MTNLSLQTQNSTSFNTAIITANTVPTMTSLEIVDFINNHRQANGNSTVLRHDNFMTKVPEVLGELYAPKFLGTQTYGNNNIRSVYIFPKREACLMAMSYSYDIQAEIYDRMTALEQQIVFQPQLPNFLDPAEAAFAWGKQYQATQLAEAKLVEAAKAIEVMQPTVDAYELIAGKKGSMCFQDAYKYLGGIKLKDMKQWMYDKGWIKKDRFGRDKIGYYQNMSGYLVEKVTTHQPQIRITYKGLAAMARQMKIKLNAEDFN